MTSTPAPAATPTAIEQMCNEASKRLAAHINRSAGQHLRALRQSASKLNREIA